MSDKKIKITVESADGGIRSMTANGIAAAILSDGKDEDHHSIQVLICGNMSVQDLVHLHDAVTTEMTERLEEVILSELAPADIIKFLMDKRGKKHESD